MERVPGRLLFAWAAVLLLCLPVVIVKGYVVQDESPYRLGKEKVTRLHFFFHDIVSGKNQTAVNVARPNSTFPFFFGNVVVIDDVLTAGVDRASEVIGNAQGFYAGTGLSNISLVMAVDFGFTSGKYKGSSFSVMSRNPVADTNRELAVVGGRGKFRLARGFALVTTRSISGLDATVEYNVTLVHY